MVQSIRNRSVSVALPDLIRLEEYTNKSEIIRQALDNFMHKEELMNKNNEKTNITETIVSFGIGIEKLKILESLCKDTETTSRYYFSVSEIVRTALRDFWLIEDKLSKYGEHELKKKNKKEEQDYLERNGITIVRRLE